MMSFQKSVLLLLFVVNFFSSVNVIVGYRDTCRLCYQCESSSEDSNPACDITYFKFLDSVSLKSLMFHCTRRTSDYCAIKVSRNADHVQTWRGCSSPTDSKGTLLDVGCQNMGDENSIICFCDQDLCNSGVSYTYQWTIQFVSVALIHFFVRNVLLIL